MQVASNYAATAGAGAPGAVSEMTIAMQAASNFANVAASAVKANPKILLKKGSSILNPTGLPKKHSPISQKQRSLTQEEASYFVTHLIRQQK